MGRDFEGSRFEWNPVFWDFSRQYGFRPAPHRPYRPQTKGKVESGVKYVKRFLRGKEFTSLDDLNSRLLEWIVKVADERIHGTTHRRTSSTDLFFGVEDPFFGRLLFRDFEAPLNHLQVVPEPDRSDTVLQTTIPAFFSSLAARAWP